MDSAGIADVFALTDRELWVVTAAAGTRHGGLIATFVSQASIVPDLPRVIVGLAKGHHTRGLIEASGAFALHLMSESQLEWVWRFALQSGRDADKLAGLAVRQGVTGAPLLEDAAAHLECRVEAGWDSGDRTVYLGEGVAGGVHRPGPVLTMKRLLQLAPAEKLRELKGLYVQDGATDAAGIRAWRCASRSGPPAAAAGVPS